MEISGSRNRANTPRIPFIFFPRGSGDLWLGLSFAGETLWQVRVVALQIAAGTAPFSKRVVGPNPMANHIILKEGKQVRGEL